MTQSPHPSKSRPGNRAQRSPTRLKNPTSTRRRFRRAPAADPVGVASRLKFAIKKARQMQSTLKAGDEDALTQATLLQGILSGDVMAASFHARQKLQRENFLLRRRLTMSRIKTETVKQRLLAIEANRRERPETPGWVIALKVADIYGLNAPEDYARLAEWEQNQRPLLAAVEVAAQEISS